MAKPLENKDFVKNYTKEIIWIIKKVIIVFIKIGEELLYY